MTKRLRPVFIILSLFLFTLTVGADIGRREFFTVNASRGLAVNSVQEIVCTKTGRMMIITEGNLNFYDGSTFNHIDTKHDFEMQLPAFQGEDRMEFDSIHHLWIKRHGNVTCVDLLNEKFIEKPKDVIEEMGCKEQVLDLFADEGSGIWLLTKTGLFNIAKPEQVFQTVPERNLQEVDVFENLLVTFYDNGEFIAYDLKTSKIVQHTRPYEWETALKYTQSTNFLRYEDGYYIVKKGKNGSVMLRYNIHKQEWKIITETTYFFNDLALLGNKLYIASSEGYWIYFIDHDVLKQADDIKFMHSSEMKLQCNAIAFDKQDGLWIGTRYRGVLYARPRTSPFYSYSFDSPEGSHYYELMRNITQNITEFNGIPANCMYKDSRNWTWVGTMQGLYLYRSPKDDPIIFNRTNGFLNNSIHSVIEDKNRNIWVGTSYGLSAILFTKDGKIDFINNFNKSDKIPDEMFVNCKAIRMPNEYIAMQTIDHIVTFHPDSIYVNTPRSFKMYPKLIKLLVNGIEVKAHEAYDGNVIIDRAITRTRDIYLNADQNSISLTFASLNYYRPIQTYYRARIKEVDENWKVYSFFDSDGLVDNGGRLHLPLMGVKPGDYQVEVQASMFPNVWEEGDAYTWYVHVNQPWWQRSGVYYLIIIVIMIILVINFVFYNRNTKMRERRNAEEGDMIRKILSFVERCDAFDQDILQPDKSELLGSKDRDSARLSPAFIDVMLRLIPYVHYREGKVSMRQLSEAGNINIVEFYDLMTANLYKQPRDLIRTFRIEKAAELLRTTDKSIEEISVDCGFYTPNYFMGSFFHRYKLTPDEYRAEQNA